jgi:hypothetical protein
MMRYIAALLAANVTAPFLFVFVAGSSTLLSSGLIRPWELLPFLRVGLIVGFVGLCHFGIPVLLLSGVVAAILAKFECRSRWHFLVVGGLSGFIFLETLFVTQGFSSWRPATFLSRAISSFGSGTIAVILSGAVCGWIYWAIAIRPMAQDRAIEPA